MANWTKLCLLAAVATQPLCALAQETAPAAPQVALDADQIFVNEAENTVIAEGNVEAEYEGRLMRADRLVYDRTNDKVRATGNVIIIDPDGTERFADEIETDSNLSDGYAIGFSTRMPNGGLATAESAVRTSDGYNALDKVVYTACELCEGDTTPTWALRARKAVLDQEDKMISYQDAVLEVGGIPVVYLPYFAHPDPNSGRRSGFLAPDFGISSKLGAFYQQPYYWAISPSQDITLSPQINGGVNPLVEVEYRKRFWSGTFNTNFSFTNERDFDSQGEKFGEKEWRSHVFADGEFDITQNWKWGFGFANITDDLYTRRYDIDGENEKRGLYDAQPRRLLNQVYTQGQGNDWYADASLLSYKSLRARDNDEEFPRALPLMFAERLFDFGDNGLLAVNGSSAVLSREVGVDSFRASLGADWDATRVLPGGVVFNPFAEGRYDYYDLSDAPSGANEVTRGAATAGARLSYPLFRPGKSVDILIEPTVMAAYGTPGVNDADIPIEDSLFYELDESRLFDANGIGNYDLYEGGSKAALGVTTTARWKNGVSISAIAGRRWRDQSDENFGITSNLDGTSSDWVTGMSADFGKPLNLVTRLRLDDEDFSVNRIDARLKTQWWRFDAQVRYYKISGDVTSSGNDDEGVDIRGQVRLSDQYFFVYSRSRDISGRTNRAGNLGSARDLRHTFGIAYEDDCSRFEIAYEKSDAVDRTLGPDESIRFRFSLKTLGDIGSRDVD